MDNMALYDFKKKSKIEDSDIFIFNSRTTKVSINTDEAKKILAENEVMDFYDKEDKHIGFIDGGLCIVNAAEEVVSKDEIASPKTFFSKIFKR